MFQIKYLLLAYVRLQGLLENMRTGMKTTFNLGDRAAESNVSSATNKLCSSQEVFYSSNTAVFSSNIRKFN